MKNIKNIFDLTDLDESIKKASPILQKFIHNNKDALEVGEGDIHFKEKDLDFVIYTFEKLYFSKSGTLLGGEYPKTSEMKIERIKELSRGITGKNPHRP